MMRKAPSIAAALTATAVLAGSAVLATPAVADDASKEVRGPIGGGSYKIDIELDDGRFETDVDIDRVARGSVWKLAVRQNGTLITKQRARASRDDDDNFGFDVDFREVNSRNTPGRDRFVVAMQRVGAPKIRAVRTVVFR